MDSPGYNSNPDRHYSHCEYAALSKNAMRWCPEESRFTQSKEFPVIVPDDLPPTLIVSDVVSTMNVLVILRGTLRVAIIADCGWFLFYLPLHHLPSTERKLDLALAADRIA